MAECVVIVRKRKKHQWLFFDQGLNDIAYMVPAEVDPDKVKAILQEELTYSELKEKYGDREE